MARRTRKPAAPPDTPPPPGLWRSFTRAARGVKDFVLWEVAIPTTKRSIAAFLLWTQIGGPLVMQAFPTAEDALQNAGLDPALVQQMGGGHIRVLPATFGGNVLLRSLFQPPGLAVVNAALSESAPQELRGVATQGFFGLSGKLFGFCAVGLPTLENYDVRTAISGLSGGEIKRNELRDDLSYTAQQSFAATALHEIRHCSQDLPTTIFHDITNAESDADAASLVALGRIFNDPQVPYVKMYARALHLDADGHDTALAVDAALRGQPLPTPDDIKAAARELDEYLDRWYLRRYDAERTWRNPTRDYARRAFTALLMRGEDSGLSPLALRRAQLYLEAWDYLAPPAKRSPTHGNVRYRAA